MNGRTGIEWTDRTWNAVVGCTKVSQGCKLCYAKTLHDMRHKAYLDGKTVAPQYEHAFEVVQLMPDRLTWPLSLRKPSRIFVNSVSDLFHENVPSEYIAQVFAIMALAERHTFQVLTKRPSRMHDLMDDGDFIGLVSGMISHYSIELTDPHERRKDDLRATAPDVEGADWPLPNVWLGVSVENQAAADERIPLLLQTPAAVRFLSCEPLLGPIDLMSTVIAPFARFPDEPAVGSGPIDWVIVGGESGSSKQSPRPMHPNWARSIRDQCVEAGVPFLFKQWGDQRPILNPADGTVLTVQRVGKKRAGRELDGRTWDEYPEARV